MKYVCNACGWVYDEEAGCPEQGIAPGTAFEDLPEDFTCQTNFRRNNRRRRSFAKLRRQKFGLTAAAFTGNGRIKSEACF